MITEQNCNTSLFYKIIFISFICTDVLYMYGWGDRNINYYSTFILGVFALFTAAKYGTLTSMLPKILWFLIIDMALVEMESRHTFPLETLKLGLTYIAVWCFVRSKNIGIYLDIYKKIGIVLTLYFYIQFVVYESIGVHLTNQILGLPICDEFNSVEFYNNFRQSTRCSSLFSEPSYLCRFLLPLIAIELFRNEKINYKLVCFFIAPVFLTVSGTGVIALMALGIFWYICNFKSKQSNRGIKIILISVIAIVFIYALLTTEIGNKILSRTDELSWKYQDGTSRSGYIRMWLGYEIFNEYPWLNKIFGDMNIQSYTTRLLNTEFASVTDESQLKFSGSGVNVLLLRQGFIGLILMLLLIKKIWKNASLTAKAIIVTFIAYMFTEFVYPGFRFAIYMIIPYCLNKQTAINLKMK